VALAAAVEEALLAVVVVVVVVDLPTTAADNSHQLGQSVAIKASFRTREAGFFFCGRTRGQNECLGNRLVRRWMVHTLQLLPTSHCSCFA
jgi:hypothetical protein